ncbi:shikimate 5-dehydrogenase [Verruconis gallopava]|uniref:Quinate dehydrogenase n=1 Tax=Verruconis gallopava TaxID=253628 RepID=A0A0D2AN76_9PEZI|nr:shikimate 5-dehydrogenase [Verruconis gallopava]KIW08183.1 shikimate 5-dehydrogenase [Verruconis gallopava]
MVTPSTSEGAKPRGKGVLFGYPIAHSMSPLMHNTVFSNLNIPWDFDFLESTDIAEFLRVLKSPECYGCAVTMPHKVAILPYLDDLTPEGRDCGAVNTVLIQKNPDGSRKYVGHNTDVVGIRESFYQNVKEPEKVFHNKPGMVVGGGGAARSAVYSLRRMMQCKPVYLVNRDKGEVDAVIAECKSKGYGQNLIHVETVEEAERLATPGAIVACVPDFPPKTENEKQARAVLETFLNRAEKGAMLEMCYHPSPWTEIGGIAEKAGWQVILGTEAMIYQGLEQDKLWTGKTLDELPKEKVKRVIAAKLGQPHL